MYKIDFLLKFTASIEMCLATFLEKNPAVVCHDPLKKKKDFSLSAFSLVIGVCGLDFVVFIYYFWFYFTIF